MWFHWHCTAYSFPKSLKNNSRYPTVLKIIKNSHNRLGVTLRCHVWSSPWMGKSSHSRHPASGHSGVCNKLACSLWALSSRKPRWWVSQPKDVILINFHTSKYHTWHFLSLASQDGEGHCNFHPCKYPYNSSISSMLGIDDALWMYVDMQTVHTAVCWLCRSGLGKWGFSKYNASKVHPCSIQSPEFLMGTVWSFKG